MLQVTAVRGPLLQPLTLRVDASLGPRRLLPRRLLDTDAGIRVFVAVVVPCRCAGVDDRLLEVLLAFRLLGALFPLLGHTLASFPLDHNDDTRSRADS